MNLSRRELILRGAFAGAALALPSTEALAAVRARQKRPSVHCLRPADKFTPGSVIGGASFVSWSPDGNRLALVTPHGIEILNKAAKTRIAVTPPGFTLGANAWARDGSAFIASGPAEDGSGPFLYVVKLDGPTRLLPAHPGSARAASFSPDGKWVCFTYVNRFTHQICMARWVNGTLSSPLSLNAVDPATEVDLRRLLDGLSWYETRGFSADGTRLYFVSDRGSGMLNVNSHYIELGSGAERHVTREDGFVEGTALSADGRVLYYSSTRAREPGFLSLVAGPAVPPFLGFVAGPTLHDRLASGWHAPIGNGDILAVDETFGLRARMIGKRETLVRRIGTAVPDELHRTEVCSMSPDQTELAVALHSPEGSRVVLLRRARSSIHPPVSFQATPRPKRAVALGTGGESPPVSRTIEAPLGGRVRLSLDGTLTQGRFEAAFEGFTLDGVKVFAGSARFITRPDGFEHTSDVRRVNVDAEEDSRTFYNADMGVNPTRGSMESRSRSGALLAVATDGVFVPQGRWKSGNLAPLPVPGAKSCRNVSKN